MDKVYDLDFHQNERDMGYELKIHPKRTLFGASNKGYFGHRSFPPF